ncbi:MAG: 1,4-dihydroxy-2-naphthoate octaprenyltransferase [Planctomycetota bacterium]
MRVLDWMKASRAPFCIGVFLSVCVGTATAWHETGRFDALLFAACLAGVVLINLGTNFANDYYDHTRGADEANPNPTPFSGGSRAIQDGVLGAKAIRNVAYLCFALAAAVGGYVTWRVGWPVLAIGAAGILIGIFYTAPPFRLCYRGFGELVTAIGFGLLPVMGAYYVQVGALSPGAILIACAPACLGAALLFINEIPDAGPDRSVGKMHLVARLGVGFGAVAYLALLAGAFASVGAGIALSLVPGWAALAFLAAPPGLWAFARAWTSGGAPGRIVPALGANVVSLVLFGTLMSAGYVIAGVSG